MELIQVEEIIIELMLAATIVGIATRYLRIPYTVALVIFGLIITLQQPVSIPLASELILALFVPPLIFEAAFHINLNELRHNLLSILMLAVPGVVLTTVLVGGIVALGAGMDLRIALVFGALISATDPVAVVAMFRALRVPRRLQVVLEGESLLNDGTAIVVFGLMLSLASGETFSLASGIVEFFRVALGGLAVGLVLGFLVAAVISRIDDHLIETTLTTVLAFGAYLVAERFHVSGVLAVVAAGLVNGNLGPRGMSPTTKIVIFNFWEYVAFLANSFVFMLIGLQINISNLWAAIGPIAIAVLAVLLSRIIVVYGLSAIVNRLRKDRLPFKWQHVLSIGGLRGAISLALVLSLSTTTGSQHAAQVQSSSSSSPLIASAGAAIGEFFSPEQVSSGESSISASDQQDLRLMTYGVVLFTLLAQSLSMQPVLKRLKLIGRRTEAQAAYELRHARLTAMRAGHKHLENMYRQGLISHHTWDLIRPNIDGELTALTEDLRQVLSNTPAVQAEEMDTARRELLRAQRSSLIGLRQDGVISEEVFEELVARVDSALGDSEINVWNVLRSEYSAEKEENDA